MTDEDLVRVLGRFNREFVIPEMERVIDSRMVSVNARLDNVNSHFDSVYQRFDRHETEYYAIKVGLERIEKNSESSREWTSSVTSRS